MSQWPNAFEDLLGLDAMVLSQRPIGLDGVSSGRRRGGEGKPMDGVKTEITRRTRRAAECAG